MTKSQPEFDVIIVGSGAAGGMSAYALSCAGVRVLMLEAGRDYDAVSETPMFEMPEDAPLRGAGTPDKPFGYFDATVDGGWQVPGEPYSSAEGTDFLWWRSRMLGGRTNHWGRISLRMGEYDFKPYSRDGLGADWPMTYEDMAPYYDKTEALIGVYGSNEGLENTPNSSPGVLLNAPAPRADELLTQKYCRELGIPVVPCHLAILSEKQNHRRWPRELHPNNALGQRVTRDIMRARAACFFATPCGRGCSIGANFQSPTVLLPPALATGNLTIRTDAMVYEVSSNARGHVNGVGYIDRITGKQHHVHARVVILAASACESARIMLNSKSTAHPQGLGNANGLVGKYVMDTVGAGLLGQIPMMENMPPHNADGASAMHMYMPWWLYQEQAKGQLDFARGYHIEFGGGRRLPQSGHFSAVEAMNGGNYGLQLKEDCRRYYGSFIGFSGRGEMIPNEDCYCEIDSEQKDKWGIPTLKFHWRWSEHELNQARHMHKTFQSIIESMGGRVMEAVATDGAEAIKKPGEIIHEVGGARMGSNPNTSVLNQFSQSWQVPNLFVTDGAAFVSNADKNPTLSIMANAWRSADYLVQEMRARNL
jgi:choline dehydrogenase-like flavoprotein